MQSKDLSNDIGINYCPSMKCLLRRRFPRRPNPRKKKSLPPPQPPPSHSGLPPGFCYLKDLLNRPPPRKAVKKRRLRPPKPTAGVVYRSAPLPEWPEEQLQRGQQNQSAARSPLPLQEMQYLQELLLQQPAEPISDHWKRRVQAKVSNNLIIGRCALAEKLCSEAEALLEEGVRLSALRYRLLDAEWRAQHGVQRYPWPFARLVIRGPTPWRCAFLLGRQFCHHNLFTAHPVLRRLQSLFLERFASVLFVPAQRLRVDAPLTLQQLEARVDALCAEARLFLIQQWLPACADVVSDYRSEWGHLAPSRRGDTLGQIDRFFGCISALMARQIRKLTLQSLEHLAEVFHFFQEGNQFTPPYKDLAMLKTSILMLSLEAFEGRISQQPSTPEVLEVARSCMLRVLKTTHTLPRLEEVLLGISKGSLGAVDFHDEEATRLVEVGVRAVEANLAGPQIYLQLYSPFVTFLDGQAEQELVDFMQQGPSLKEWARFLDSFKTSMVKVTALRRKVPLNMLTLECGQLNDLISERLDSLRKTILDYHITNSRTHNRRICNEFDEMSDKAAVLPEDTAGLVALTQYLTHCQDVRMLELRKMIRIAAANLCFLVTHAIFPGEDVQLNARVFLWPRDMEAVFSISRQRLAHRREVVEAALRDRKAKFEAGLLQNQQHLHELQRKDPAILTVEEMRDSVNLVTNLAEALQRDKCIAEAINEEESLLNWLPAPFSELHLMLTTVKPFQLLWTTVLEFHQKYDHWYFGSFKELDANVVEENARKMHKVLSEVAVALAKVPGSKRIAELTRSKLEQFINLLPLLHCVCTPGLCARHWEQMSETSGEELNPEKVTTLAQVVDFGLMEHVALFQEVAECARREMALHQQLLSMKAEWEDILLPCVPYRDAGVATLGSLDHIQLMLDDHILRAQTMHSSPFVRAFEAEMQSWEEKLISMQDILDSWLTCQALWLYLAPIFSSEDIMRQMPSEGAKFARVDKSWRDIMANTDADPHVLSATDMPEMLVTLRDCNSTLEQIQKGLNEYLEKKRIFFPRFYFLSNDELLEVLSETKDPCLVRVDKCFEGVARIELGAEGEVTCVQSPEGESLNLSGRLVPSEAKGNVEKWLAQLEDVLVRSLKDTCREAVAAYQRQPRHQWVLQWPSQAVSVAAAIHWTTEAAAAIRNNELKEYIKKSTDQITTLYELSREEHPVKIRSTLINLLQSDLHNVSCLKALNSLDGVQSYSWNSNVRHYWREDTVIVSLAGCDLPYGFEYLGCPLRLVITPHTASVIRAMVLTMRGGLSACLMGKSAVGKTETCREAARIIARPFIVFSCSKSLALNEILKFLKGTVKAGAWLCLEGVDRLRTRLVSAFSQHLNVLGVAASSNNSFNYTSAVIAISNEALPRSLVAQFRPIFLSEPDVFLTTQLFLQARGFKFWKQIADKVSQLYNLLRDLLPKEQHYDFTFHSLKSILQRTGSANIFKQDPQNEHQQFLQAVESFFRPILSASDLPMYDSILNEVFGEVAKIPIQPQDEIRKVAVSRGLHHSKSILAKIDQLKDALDFRPAVILLGQALSGKTTSYQVLASAMPHISNHQTSVTYKVVNPKALTQGRLLGQFDASGEWLDGILSSTFREFSATASSEEQKWIILDGPIEMEWADSLNTALDETRLLCLASGEMIKRGQHIRLILETSELNNCSPSLVGRCSVIYFESRLANWQELKVSLIQTTLRKKLAMDEQWELISELIEWLVPSVLALTITLETYLSSSDLVLFNSFQKMYTGMLRDDLVFSSLWLQNALIFSLVWGLGSILTHEGRIKFDVFFRKLINGENKIYPRPKAFKLTPQQLIPDKGLVFDWFLDRKNNGTWVPWMDTLSKVHSLQQVVSSPSVAIQRYFTASSLSSEVPLLLIGPRGCGKSCVLKEFLQGLNPDEHLVSMTSLSGGTTADQLQQTVVGRLDRRRKGVFGPPMGRRCVLLVDGLGDHSGPAELLRQWLGHGYWYNVDNSKLELVDMVMVGTCNEAKKVPKRLLGQVFLLGLEDLTDAALEKIFTSKFVDNHLSKGFPSNICRMGKGIVASSMDVFRAARSLSNGQVASRHLFDLADSLIQVPSTNLGDADKLARLWIHETQRNFIDALCEAQQRNSLFDIIRVSCKKHLGKPLDLLMKRLLESEEAKIDLTHMERHYFGNFMEPDANIKIYDEICDEATLREKVSFYLREYLHDRGTPLVLTQFLLQHTARVCRAIQRPIKGHAVLVGEPGSGRTTVAKIAAIISGQNILHIKPRRNYGMKDWQEDLKKTLISCGPEDKSTVLILRENILNCRDRLENLQQILANGEMPTLWDSEDRVSLQEGMNVLAKVKGKKIDPNSTALNMYFVERVRVNLHVILIISPKGDLHSKTLEDFPSLVENSAINFFDAWPAESLKAIAAHYVGLTEVGEEAEKCAAACHLFQQSSPHEPQATFLRLMRCFVRLHGASSKAISTKRGRYISGLQKLDQAAEQVIEMREKLQHLRPQLVETSEETDRLMIKIEQDTVEVEARKEIVGSDESKANEAAAAAQAIKDDCESDLAEAVPALEAALTALDTLKPSDITLVKSMKNPPTGVKLVLEAICVMKGVKPDRKPHTSGSGKMVEDFWAPSLRLIGEIKFLESLKTYEKDDIPPPIMTRIRDTYIHDREFRPEIVRKSSTACEGLCKWVRAIEVYDRVIKIVSPKKAKLAEAEAALALQMATLNEKRAQLQQVSDKLQTLNDDFAAMSKKKKDLEDNIDICSQKLERAAKLIGGLGGEKSRWGELASSLEGRLDNVTGDVLLAAATVSYLGALEPDQRRERLELWSRQLEDLGLAHSKPFSLTACLGDAVKMREWQMGGLSEDPYAVESALVAFNCDAWPLLLDPQGQAVEWICSTEKNLLKTSTSCPDFSLQVEKAVQEGLGLLVRLHEPKIPPILDKPYAADRTKGRAKILLGDAEIEVNDSFQLYLCLGSSATLCADDLAKVTVVNFRIQPRGLERRLLALVVGQEEASLEVARHELAVEGAENQIQLQQIEQQILDVLSDAETNILEDETGLQVLSASKALSAEISCKQVVSKEKEVDIETARSKYEPVARQAAEFYFILESLARLHPLYQFSLSWYIQIYSQAVGSVGREPGILLAARLESLIAQLTKIVFLEVSPGLFDRHRQILALMLWFAQLKAKDQLDETAWTAFLSGQNLGTVNGLEDLDKNLVQHEGVWKRFKETLDDERIPEPYSKVRGLAKLAFIRAMRPHQLGAEIRRVVAEEMGEAFLRPPAADVSETVAAAGNERPVVVALGSDSEPGRSLERAAEERPVRVIYLGEGQEAAAEAAISDAAVDGSWLVLQNCHLAASHWPTTLERLAERALASGHAHFRLVLTFDGSGVTLGILQRGVKVAGERSGGLRSRVLHCFQDVVRLGSGSREDKTLLLATSLLHAVAQARGLSNGHSLTEEDFDLALLLSENSSEWGVEGVATALSESVYGVRTSDAGERSTLRALAEYYVCPEVLKEEAVRVARLTTPDLDLLEDDLAPETLHLSRSVRWTQGMRQAQTVVETLKKVFGWQDEKCSDAEKLQPQVVLKPLRREKKPQSAERATLVLDQEISLLNKEIAAGIKVGDSDGRYGYLQKWLAGSAREVWLGGVARPKALLRALSSTSSELVLQIAQDDSAPLFSGVQMDGAFLKDGVLGEATDSPTQILPLLQFAPNVLDSEKTKFKCPLYESRDSLLRLGSVLLPSGINSIKWKLRGVACFVK